MPGTPLWGAGCGTALRRLLLLALAGLAGGAACSGSPVRHDLGGDPDATTDRLTDGTQANQPPVAKILRNPDGSQRIFTQGQDIGRKGETAQGVEIQYNLTDAESDPCSLSVEYTFDNGLNWSPASVAIFGKSKGERIDQIPSRPAAPDGGDGGLNHRINWDVYRDLGPLGGRAHSQDGKVIVRITPSDSHVGTGDTSDPFFVPPRPGDVHRFGVLESPTFVTAAKLGYTAYLAMIPSDAELAQLSGADGMPGSYDDLLFATYQNAPRPAPTTYTVYAGIDDVQVRGVGVTPNGPVGLFVRVPDVLLNGGAQSPAFLFDAMARVLPGQPGYSPLWTIPNLTQMIAMETNGARLTMASHFFENGRRYIADLSETAPGPDLDGDNLPDYIVLADGTKVQRCVDTDTTGQVVVPCLDGPTPPRILAPGSFTPKPAGGNCLATLPTFKQMVDRGFNAIVVDIVADPQRLARLSGADGKPGQGGDDPLIVSDVLRDAAGTNPDPQFQLGITYWYPGAGDACAEGVGRAPDGRPALYLIVPEEDKNNLGAVVMQNGVIAGGGYLESNVGRPLPGEPGYSPLFNVPATWEELRDLTRANFPNCALADHYWEQATVYLTQDQLAQGQKGADADGDGCADSITVGGTTYQR